jgi:uncharacterized protein
MRAPSGRTARAMNDIPPPDQHLPDPAAQTPAAPQPAEGTWAAGVSSGPAGWPGAIHANYTAPSSGQAAEAPPIQPVPAPAPVAEPAQPPVTTPVAPPIAAPAPQPRIEQVEARPISAAEKRGPTIDAPPAVRVEHTQPPLFPPQPVYQAPSAPQSGASAPAQPASAPFQAAPTAAQTPPNATQAAWSGASAASAPSPAAGSGATIPPAPAVAPAPRRFERPPSPFWTAILHLAFLLPIPPHISGLVLTALIWVWRRGRDPHIEQQGREALNFQLTYLAASALLGATCIGTVLIPVVWITGAVLCIVAAVHAADGERYRYPLIFRLIA